jgi:type IV/VI secretion system ImpK/VasF family protein
VLSEPVQFACSNSQAFDINTSINPLVAAAASVILTITSLKKQTQSPIDISQLSALHHPLIQEIKIFEEKARKLEYRSALIMAARYFLCSFADEVMNDLLQAQNSEEANQLPSLLETLQAERYGGERFYLILERASADPVAHIDLLELGCLCLSLGYRGKYHEAEHPIRELENIRDQLLLLITRIRGNPPAMLLIKSAKNHLKYTKYTKHNTRQKNRRLPHALIATGLFIVGALLVYLPYNMQLSNMAKPLAQLMATHH